MTKKDVIPKSAIRPETVDPEEIGRFNALPEQWWKPDGAFRVVHKFNPVRRGFIVDRIGGHFDRRLSEANPFDGLKILDVGCGAGLLSEPMAERGASVVGIDATDRNVEVARWHPDAPTARVPRMAMVLGAAGALPILALSIVNPFVDRSLREQTTVALTAYGVVILSFLGSIHWGLAINAIPAGSEEDRLFRRLGYSVVPALIGWIAFMKPPTVSLSVLATAFTAVLYLDPGRARHQSGIRGSECHSQ